MARIQFDSCPTTNPAFQVLGHVQGQEYINLDESTCTAEATLVCRINLSRQALSMRVEKATVAATHPRCTTHLQIGGFQRAAGRSCGFREAGHIDWPDIVLYYRHVADSDVTRRRIYWSTTCFACVRATSGRSRGRASPHALWQCMSDRMRACVRCVRHGARKRGALARTLPASRQRAASTEYRSLFVVRRLVDFGGYVLAVSGWICAVWGRVGLRILFWT